MLTNYQNTITRIFANLKAGDPDAMDQLWEAYFSQLMAVARKRMSDMPKQMRDEEDVLISVFDKLWDGAKKGRLDNFRNRDDLWMLLVKITKNKVGDFKRYETREKRDVRRTEEAEMVEITSQEPTAEFVVALKDELKHRLDRLKDEALQQIAVLQMENYTDDEIAARLGISKRTIERKSKVIRDEWGKS